MAEGSYHLRSDRYDFYGHLLVGSDRGGTRVVSGSGSVAQGAGGVNKEDVIDILLDLRNLAENMFSEEDVQYMKEEIDLKLKEIK